jgi:tRNA-modifying protein YgfZ
MTSLQDKSQEKSWHYQFPSCLIYRVAGMDAERYLHARFAANIKALAEGCFTFGAALTAQGKVEIYATILREQRVSLPSYLVVVEGGDSESVEKALRRFIVADRVSVEDISPSCTLFTSPTTLTSATASQYAVPLDEVIIWPHARTSAGGNDVLTFSDHAFSTVVDTMLPSHPITEDEYSFLRLEYGTPSFPLEVNDSALPFEVGIYHAVAFNKGCYIGQEVIEKMDAYGRVPRTAWVAELRGIVDVHKDDPVTVIEDNLIPSPIGKVLSAVNDGGARTLVAVLVKSSVAESSDIAVQGIPSIRRWRLQAK